MRNEKMNRSGRDVVQERVLGESAGSELMDKVIEQRKQGY